MKSASSFLLASRRCEIVELEQLARTCELVGVFGRLVHALQRERGLANLLLSSGDQRFDRRWREQIGCCDAAQQEVLSRVASLETRPDSVRNGSRLFSRVALVLHALDGLPALRSRIASQSLQAQEVSAAFGKLIAGLLAVVFEAADSASDPEISRALVALLHFMQGKEFAGQERALGARAFAAGTIDAAGQQHWRHLVESQQSSFQVLVDFGDTELAQAAHVSRDPAMLRDLERLRHIGCSMTGTLDVQLSEVWYDVCTRRIDALKNVEDKLALDLRRRCERRIAQGRGELVDQRETLDKLLLQAQPADPGRPAPLGPQLDRAVLEMAQAQSRRLQAMADELESVRARLNERKLVERAKGLLMASHRLSEDEAYKTLRQLAMNQNRRMADVASSLLSLADVLPGGAR